MSSTVKERLLEQLAKDHACYVLLTCDEADENGKLNVDLAYEGDPVLAAYLLEGAQSFIDDQVEADQLSVIDE